MAAALCSRALLLQNRPWTSRHAQGGARTSVVAAATGGELSPQERFDALVRSKPATLPSREGSRGVAVQEWNDEQEVSSEARARVNEKLQQQALIAASEGSERMDSEKPSKSIASPSDPRRAYEEREKARMERRRLGMLEYEQLKRELEKLTIGVGALCGTYCFFVLSLEAAASYGVGVFGSYLYLQLLYREADQISSETVPEIFRERKQRKNKSLLKTGQRVFEGSRRALSSQRLVIPAILMGLWAASKQVAGDVPDSFHLEVVPLFLGFLAYKGAALVFVYRDNKDLLF